MSPRYRQEGLVPQPRHMRLSATQRGVERTTPARRPETASSPLMLAAGQKSAAVSLYPRAGVTRQTKRVIALILFVLCTIIPLVLGGALYLWG